MINDLTGKFLDSYDPDHSRHEIAKYDPYFLGSIVISNKQDKLRFVKRDLDFYASQTIAIRTAAKKLTEGWESIRYNEDRGFTLQTQVILAALTPDDPEETTRRKVAMAADFLDIWLARRAWNFRTTSYSSVKYTVFILTKELRGRNLAELSAFLREQLDVQPERFATQPRQNITGTRRLGGNPQARPVVELCGDPGSHPRRALHRQRQLQRQQAAV